jgi:hypothetical protein
MFHRLSVQCQRSRGCRIFDPAGRRRPDSTYCRCARCAGVPPLCDLEITQTSHLRIGSVAHLHARQASLVPSDFASISTPTNRWRGYSAIFMRAWAENSPRSANPLPNAEPRTAPTRRSAPRRGPDPGGRLATGAVSRIATLAVGRDSTNRETGWKSRVLARI